MSEGPSDHDRDLLSRLNALKQSSIDLDAKQCDYLLLLELVTYFTGMSNGRKIESLKNDPFDR